MGIAYLSQCFDLKILDLTAWLMPVAFKRRTESNFKNLNLKKIASHDELKRELDGESGGYALDYVGQFSPSALMLFNTLKSHGISIIVVDSGAHPAHKGAAGQSSLLAKLRRVIGHGSAREHINGLLVRVLRKLLPDQRPDIALVAGQSWRGNPRFAEAAQKAQAHSFDYELFLRTKDQKSLVDYPYAVYLDEKITSHEDNIEHGVSDPASSERLLPSIGRFFAELERRTGLRVVIAGYPSAHPEVLSKSFGDRPAFVGQTARLVKDASLVLAHGTTSVSFAVIARKPVVFLTSQEILNSWYQPSIELLRSHLGAALVNIDDQPSTWPDNWMTLDQSAYDNYRETFIKACDAPDRSLWETLSEVLE